MSKKKQKEFKSLEDRKEIVKKIRRVFQDHGISLQEYTSLVELESSLKEYESCEKLIAGFSGKFYIPEINRYLEYRLPVAKQTPEFIRLYS